MGTTEDAASVPPSSPLRPPAAEPGSARSTASLIFRLGAAAGASGVCMGAFGAHALRDHLSAPMMEIYRTAVLYHLVHAAVLLALSAATAGGLVRRPRLSAALFSGGIAIFSGTLYLLSITGVRILGAITPLGGVALITGWLSLLWRPRR